MDKRTFIKQLTTGIAMASTPYWLGACNPPKKKEGTLLPPTAATPPIEPGKNWVWARPNDAWGLDDWKKQLAQAKDSGFDAVLLEVYNGREAFFDNKRLPVKEDLLSKVLPICQAEGLELHTWMWTMPCNIESVVKAHPEWYAVNGLGQSAATHPAYVDYYKFLCPCHPEAREFVMENANSLAGISETAGLHLDYVRLPDVILAEGLQPKYGIVQDKEYPQYDYCYSDFCREAFKSLTGIDPLKDLKNPSENEAWRQFRYDQISSLVNEMLVPVARKNNKQITAAVFPNWESVRQAWHTWHLDGFLPMLYSNFYNRDNSFVSEHVTKAQSRLKEKKPIYAGLFVPELSPVQLQEAIEMAIASGASGFSAFDLGSLNNHHFAMLKEMIKRNRG